MNDAMHFDVARERISGERESTDKAILTLALTRCADEADKVKRFDTIAQLVRYKEGVNDIWERFVAGDIGGLASVLNALDELQHDLELNQWDPDDQDDTE